MADVATTGEKSLDDFFAKRDKKKKKDKSKSKDAPPVSGHIAAKKNKKEKDKTTKNESQDDQVEKEDEEWKDFEQKEVDYSGLRVQALQLSDEKEEEEYEKEELGEDGQVLVISSDKISGPWNKSGSVAVAVPPVEVEVLESKVPGVYRPPGARLTGPRRGPPQGPPEIFSDTQFPSLLSTAKHVESRRDREMEKTFEVVKHRTRAREEVGGASVQHLQLDNQFAVLGDK